jgi:outer membrane receptor protein involved in Fe transport
LVDKKRHVASSSGTSSVDTNAIPSSRIDRVEIITGGASAVYGADAVTVVVNVVLKKDITGLNVSAIKGFADNSSYQNEKYTFSYGQDFADGRGNAAFSLEYNSQNSLNALDNPWTATSYTAFPYALTTGMQRPADKVNDEAFPDHITLPNAGFYVISNQGTVWDPFTGDILGLFYSDSSLPDVYAGPLSDADNCASPRCDFINLQQYREVQPKFERVNYNFKTNYDVADELNAYYLAKNGKKAC